MAREMAAMGNGIWEWTPQHHHNEGVKTRFVTALFANDWDVMATLIHPDFELREPNTLAYGGTYKGLDGFKRCWELIPQAGHKTEYLGTLRNHFTENPNSIVVELETRGVQVATGERFATKVMEQFEFIDGLISAIILYWYDVPLENR
jgi:ketosteroid isomerase-like protein